MILSLDKSASEPLYKQLGDALLKKIHAEEILPHEKLPPIRVLAASLHVNNATVVAAYKYLEKKGAAYSILGSGTFAAKIVSDVGSIESVDDVRGDCINFFSLATDPALFPADDFRRAFDEVLVREGAGAFAFPGTRGYAPLREIIGEIFFEKTPQNIQIIQSAGEGLEILADALISPGDAVVTETPSAPGAAAVFASRGAKILEVPVNDEGVDLDRLTFFVKKFKPKIFFLTPNFQMPTTLCYSDIVKLRVLELAYNSNAYIIEEDLQNDFFYNGTKPLTLKNMDEYNRVIYLKSFDRVLTPGLAGFLACPDEIIKRLRGFGGASGYIQRGLGFYLKNSDFFAHLEKLRKAYGRKYHKAVSAAKSFLAPQSFAEPGGGLGLWIRATGDTSSLADEILSRKVLVAPGALFSVYSFEQQFFRVNFAGVTEDEVSRGIGTIASVLRGF
ncbi:MAG: PLP-dependent aminotransferase family protein [Defluviitaleaceae bacterium]|nr:PLP-dependent aminotransferase family protein [Defluviitaleaceae bacterium]